MKNVKKPHIKFASMGYEFLEAHRSLDLINNSITKFYHVKYLLISKSIEYSLKSLISLNNSDTEEIKRAEICSISL